MRAHLLILMPLALAACRQAEEPTGGNAVAAGFSPTQAKLVGLSQAQQQGVFLRAIRDGNTPCQGVSESHRQSDQDGDPVFVARCTDGPVYGIVVSRDGVAQVTRVSSERR